MAKASKATTAKEIKDRMALPPIPHAPTRDRGNRNRSGRIRMEISMDQCDSFIEMLGSKLRAMTMNDPEFKPLYGVYYALKAQRDKTDAKEEGK